MQSHEYLVRAYLDQAQRTGEVSAAESLELYESGDGMSEQEAIQLFKAYDVDASGQLELPEVHAHVLYSTYLPTYPTDSTDSTDPTDPAYSTHCTPCAHSTCCIPV